MAVVINTVVVGITETVMDEDASEEEEGRQLRRLDLIALAG